VSLVYWDTMLFIYWFEDSPQYGDRVRTIFQGMEERKDVLCTSAFTIGEILVAPLKKGDATTAEKFQGLFRPPFVRILPFTAETAVRYARIRAGMTVSPADAIQLASAAEAGANLFLTNDRSLAGKKVEGIDFVASLDVNVF
jgi:predicted nucleic acid-binding protein